MLAASPELANDAAAELEAALGYPISRLGATDSQLFVEGDPLDAAVLADAARAIAESRKERALVIAERGGLRVIWHDD